MAVTSELLDQRALRKGELEELILRDEIHWRQKARVKWVKEGDYNSLGFFIKWLMAGEIGNISKCWKMKGA